MFQVFSVNTCRSALLAFFVVVFTVQMVAAPAGDAVPAYRNSAVAHSGAAVWQDRSAEGDTIVVLRGEVRTLDQNMTLARGTVLIIRAGGTLIVPAHVSLKNEGSIFNDGTIQTSSGLTNTGSITNAHRIVNHGGVIENRGSFINAPGAVVANDGGGSMVYRAPGSGNGFATLRNGALPNTGAGPTFDGAVGSGTLASNNPPAAARRIVLPHRSAEERTQQIEDRDKWEYDQLKDPATGEIPRHIRQLEYDFAKTLPKRESSFGKGTGVMAANSYTAMGPNNLGGRTRALAFDVNNSSIMLAGGVSTGMFRSGNGGSSWTNVTPSGEVHNVSCVAQDTRSGYGNIWYYGTGEAYGNSAGEGGAFYYGHGIFKSTDNGSTWAQLSSTSSTLTSFSSEFDFVSNIAVDPTNGYVYAAAQLSIMRSTDGGTSWTTVLGGFGGSNLSGITDVVVTTGGRLYASFAGNAGSTLNGVWTSTTGAASSWTRIAGSGSPTGWNASGAYGRIVLALAPSNQNILYALYDNDFSSNCSGTAAPEADLFKYDHATTHWYNLSANMPNESGCLNGNDPFAVQGGYNLVVAVRPTDTNFVVIGGTNAYRSTNGFQSTAATTRIGGYASASTYALYANHHPDVHALMFDPNNASVLASGHDGGISKTSDVTATPLAWTSMNNDYVTYQYYHVALDPTVAALNAIGGAQDNGTTVTTGSTTFSPVWSGDGVAVGISENNALHYLGSQYGSINRRDPTDPYHWGTSIKPNGSGYGMFITYFYLNPDNTEQLWYANGTSLYRTTSASTVTSSTWTHMTNLGATTNINALATSRGVYQTSHKLYIGTDGGQLLRLDDPANAAANTVPVSIHPSGTFPGYISGIAVDPTDDKKVMVTLSNYSITSIYYTDDASVANPTWTAVEGNLTLPSIRSCVIVPRNGFATEYYVGTSIGFYSTTSLNGASTVWAQEGSATIGLAVVRSLAYRPFDNRILLGTHGNGMFYADVSSPPNLAREWRGATSTAWTTTTNWSHGAVPTSTDDVLIPAYGVTDEASISSSITVNNLTIETGRTLTISSSSGSLTINGHLVSSGTMAVNGTFSPVSSSVVSGSGTINGSGTIQVTRAGSPTDDFADQYTISNKSISGLTVEYAGSGAQKSATSPFGSLKINNSSGVALQSPATVEGDLDLTDGVFNLGASHLTLGAAATVSGTPSATAMVAATGLGELRKVFTGTGSFTYPIGDVNGTAEYSPATLNFTSGSFSSAYAGIRLSNAKHPSNTSQNDYLNRYWSVSSSGISSFSCATTFKYLDADIVGTESNIFAAKYDAPSWSLLNPVNAAANELTGTVTGFSDFSGGETGAVPVELVIFTAHLRDGRVQLGWKTATELNNYGFEIERSYDGRQWHRLGFVSGAGTSNVEQSYAYHDELSATDLVRPLMYYRLVQVDRDGGRSYSSTVSIHPGAEDRSIALHAPYPNPVSSSSPGCVITFSLPVERSAIVTVYDLNGAYVSKLSSSSSFGPGVHSFPFNTTQLSRGTYIVELRVDEIVLRRTLHVMR